jgi:uncharacterized membrane protein
MSEDRLAFNRRAVRPVECLRNGWQLIKDDYWLFLGISLCGLLLAGLVPFYILMGPMFCGIYLCLFRREAGRRVSFDMLFKGFDYFAQSLIATLIMVVPILLFVGLFYGVLIGGMVFMTSTLSAQPQGQPAEPTAVWGFVAVYVLAMLALFLFMLIVGVLFQFIYPLIVDRGLSGPEAVRLSARAALGNLGGLLGLMLLGTLLGLLGSLAGCVGVYFVYPISFAMTMMAYRQVFPADGSVLFEPPPTDWPPSLEPVAKAEQTGIQRLPDSPISVTRPPDE